jgi:DEAD/DEAH box helicase domain-containing protein
MEQLINHLHKGKFASALNYERVIPAKEAEYIDLDVIESSIIRDAVKDMGIERLYIHQAESYKQVRAGKDIIVTTPTASGKTMCYNLPICEHIYHDRNVKALYLFPLKALGHDQQKTLDNFLGEIPLGGGIKTAVIDGDTDKKLRRKILKENPNIIISNPDILHYSMLAKKEEWDSFLSGLKYLVVDELHTYRGVFGSHVYNLFARFKRLYPHVQIVACSATVASPAEFAGQLFGRDFVHVDKSGAPSGKKHFMMFNPDTSPSALADYLLKANMEAGVKTICFTKSRKQTETIFARAIAGDPSMASKLSSYRAGFLPEERREIEKKFSDGSLKAVISTSAFELGLDIGGVDSTILVGYPGSMMSLWQRAGRSGRGVKDSLILMIAGNDALDQYYVRKPELLFEGKFEELAVDRENIEINEGHIICAAYERPISRGEIYYLENSEQIENLALKGRLFEDADKNRLFALGKYPYGDVDLRMAGDSYTLNCMGMLIATNSGRRVYTENFEGAVYLHRGSQFIVKSRDKQKREIELQPFNGNYYTVPLTEKQTSVLKERTKTKDGNLNVCFSDLRVTERLTGYSKISARSGEKLQDITLEEDPVMFETKGMYFVLPPVLRKEIEEQGLNYMGAIHAFEHSVIAMLPTVVLSSREDVGGISYPYHPQLESSAVFIYDGYPGGVGIVKRAFGRVRELLETTLNQVTLCSCEDGCPSCIYSPKCGSGNYPLDKKGAAYLIKRLLEADIQEAEIDNKEDKPMVELMNTNEVLVYDIETKYSSVDVGGWNNTDKMGVSVAVVYCIQTGEYTAYREEQVGLMIERLSSAKMILGFNNIGFDNKVLAGYGLNSFRGTFVFDILADIRSITGQRFSLDKLAQSTLNVGKSADGLQALEWYKQGRFDLIEEYCTKDVEVTKDLFMFGVEKGFIHAPMKDGSLIRIPVKWNEILSSYISMS